MTETDLVAEIESLRRTNRRLNRVNQQLQSDIANDRHLLDVACAPGDEAQAFVEARQSWPHKRDRALLYYHKECIAATARAKAAEAKLASIASPINPEEEKTR